MEAPIANLESASEPEFGRKVPRRRHEWPVEPRRPRWLLVGLTLVTIAALVFVAARCAGAADDAASTTAGEANLLRQNFSQTWTGSELVVWGGWGNNATASGSEGRTMFGDGAAYDPGSKSWRQIPAGPLEPRWGHVAFWDGDEVVVIGGVGVDDGAAWNPSTNQWRELGATTPYETQGWNTVATEMDGELIVWEGRTAQMWSYSSDADEWTELPKLPMSTNTGRVRHVDGDLVAVGLPMPTEDQQIRAAILEPDRDEWRLVAELDGSTIGEIDVAVLSDGSGDESLLMWGSASAAEAWRLSEDFAWAAEPGPGLTPCDGAPEVARAGDHLVVRSLCDDAAVVRPLTGEGAWTPVDFPHDSDPAPVWTDTELLGLGFGGDIYTWSP